MRPLKVSVIVTSFNHEKYIAQCLQSVLAQKLDADVDVILGDDQSADGTGRIMQDYAQKYPARFKCLPAQAHLGVTKNIQRCLAACSGDYIAFCEGDDYWLDDRKLQKQVEYLEGHPEYSACFNALKLYLEDEHRFVAHPDQVKLKKQALSTADLIECNHIGNLSCCMYRASTVRKIPQSVFDLYMVDWLFNLACSRVGPIGYIPEPMSVYRIHGEGAWSSKTAKEQRDDLLSLVDSYNRYFNYEFNEQFLRKKDMIRRQYAAGRMLGPLSWMKNRGLSWMRGKET